MESELRVPPAVTVGFERLALSICEEAKLDFAEWASKTHELVGHLQELWREGVELGLNTDASEARALDAFGTVEQVGRSLRLPWFRRYMLFERYRGQRYAAYLCGATLCAYAGVGRLVIENEQHYSVGSVGFFYLLATSLNGAVCLAALLLVKWQPAIQSSIIRAFFAGRWIVAPMIVLGLLNVTVFELIFLPSQIVYAIRDVSNLPGLVFDATASVLGLLGAACYISELLSIPQRRSEKLQRELLSAQTI